MVSASTGIPDMTTPAGVMRHLHLPRLFPVFVSCHPASSHSSFLRIPALKNSLDR